MKTVYKYKLPGPGSANKIMMPKGAKILHVDSQGSKLYMWAEVDTSQEDEFRQFEVYGTGWELPDGNKTFLGTIIVDPFVWHVYEIEQEI